MERDFVRYASAADIVASYATGCTYATWAELEAARFIVDGACVGRPGTDAQHDEAYVRGVVVETEAKGAWGFCVGTQLHVWIAPTATPREAAELIGHELTHAMREDITNQLELVSDEEWARHYAAEEKICDQYGEIAAQTVELMVLLGIIRIPTPIDTRTEE